MKTTIFRRAALLVALVALALFLTACGAGEVELESTTYDLNEVGNSGVSGTITFTEASETETTVDIDLTGTVDGFTHPAHVHVGDGSVGGTIYVFLPFVNGTTGEASFTGELTVRDGYTPPPGESAGSVVTYDELLAFDGYVNVHLGGENASPSDQGDLTVVAQGEVGAGATPSQ